MFGVKNVCIGEKIYATGTHFVLSEGFNSSSMFFENQAHREIYSPEGYTVVNYFQIPRVGPEILYVNNVSVKAKVYQKKKERFCPDFGTPVTVCRHR